MRHLKVSWANFFCLCICQGINMKQAKRPLVVILGPFERSRRNELNPRLLWVMKHADIAGMVASITEGDPRFPLSAFCFLLSNFPNGGQGVWVFSQSRRALLHFREAFVAEKLLQR